MRAIANRHAVIGVLPHNIGNDFARFRRRMNGQFNVFHNQTPFRYYYNTPPPLLQVFPLKNAARVTLARRKIRQNLFDVFIHRSLRLTSTVILTFLIHTERIPSRRTLNLILVHVVHTYGNTEH